MKYELTSAVIGSIMALGLVSCGDDPEMVRKSESQKAEIARLRAEIASNQATLEKMPADLQEQLDQAGNQQVKQVAEIGRLEEELTAMTRRDRELRHEFEAYRSKYRLTQP